MQTTDRHCLIVTTTDTDERARIIADAVVEQELGACVQSMPISSIYRWQGSVSRDKEILLLIKTRTALAEEVERLITSLHTYEVPEIICLPIIAGSEAYLRWVDRETKGAASGIL